MSHIVYMLRCCDGSLYTGIAEDPGELERAHNEGIGAAYTFRRRPVKLVYAESHADHLSACKREKQLKGWSQAKKESLIAGDIAQLKLLSRRKG